MVGLGVDEEQQDGALRLEPSSAALQEEEQGPHQPRGREGESRERVPCFTSSQGEPEDREGVPGYKLLEGGLAMGH